MAKKKKTQAAPLTGKELLAKLKELSHLSKREKARKCGYTINGRVSQSGFMNALLEAQGITLDSGPTGNGKGGRQASYRLTVQQNGNLLVGSIYTQKMDLSPGDEFEVKLGRKHIQLKLVEE